MSGSMSARLGSVARKGGLIAGLAFAFGLMAFPAAAQTGQIVGQVRDAASQRPLEAELPLTTQDDEEQETKELFRLYQELAQERPETLTAFKALLDQLRDQINRFFDIVLVMAEDEELRNARLSLLQRIAALPEHLADLTLLEGF